MYKAIVRLLARRTLARLSNGELDRFLMLFNESSVFCFYGDHALGGEVRGREAVRALFERVFRLFPSVRIEPIAIAVNGWPWNSLVATRFTVRAKLPDGSAYRNAAMQYLRLRLGKVVEDRPYEDTAALADDRAVLARLRNED